MKVTLIFDGDCGFCTSAANFAADRAKIDLQIVPWQRADLEGFGLTEAAASAKVQLHVAGKNYAGHECFAKLLQLRGGWLSAPLGRAMLVPPVSWLAAIGYSLVARFRHHLPGGTPACKLEPK